MSVAEYTTCDGPHCERRKPQQEVDSSWIRILAQASGPRDFAQMGITGGQWAKPSFQICGGNGSKPRTAERLDFCSLTCMCSWVTT